jgi:hypothetical protein
MNSLTHTVYVADPVPWAMRSRPGDRPVTLRREHWEIGSANGRGVAIAFGDDEANAAKIIRAVNNHARLVSALAGLVIAVEQDSRSKGISGFTGARLADAREALHTATGPDGNRLIPVYEHYPPPRTPLVAQPAFWVGLFLVIVWAVVVMAV